MGSVYMYMYVEGEGGREGGSEGEREGGRGEKGEGGGERGKEGGRKSGREGGREGEREGGREGRREGRGREGGLLCTGKVLTEGRFITLQDGVGSECVLSSWPGAMDTAHCR